MIYYGVDENGRVLQHYGVPGMRWGHHKYVDPNGELSAYGRKKFASGVTGYDAEKQIIKAEDKAFKKNQRQYVNIADFSQKKRKLQEKQKVSDKKKYTKKINRLDVKIAEAKNDIQQGNDFVNKVISANNANGFKTKKYDVVRRAVRENYLEEALLPGLISQTSVNVGMKTALVENKDSVDLLAARRKYASNEFNDKVNNRLEKQKKKYKNPIRNG